LLIADSFSARIATLLLAGTVGLAGVLQLTFLGVSGTHLARPARFSFDADTRALVCRALPGMIAQSGPQLLLVAGAVTASASPAAVSWIYFASRLVELPLGLVGSATGAVLIPELSGVRTEPHEPAAASSAALQLTFGFALPASVGLGLLATPIVQLLFERGAFTADDTRATALALTVLATALPALALTKPLGAIFFAREEMGQPMFATLAGLAATIVFAGLVHPHIGYPAVAAAISLGAWLIAIWLGTALAARRELPIDHRAIRNLCFIVLATAVMEIVVAYAQPLLAGGDGFWARLCTLGALIALGLFVYAACLRLFGVVNFRIIRRAF
jgi:putative peptidoglycan lipid II flippase